MYIGLFQLENLILSQVRFLFFDLRTGAQENPPAGLAELLKRAEKLSSNAVEERLNSGSVDKSNPIILLCEDGQSSGRLAARLEEAGFANVYVVGGGVRGLLAEL